MKSLRIAFVVALLASASRTWAETLEVEVNGLVCAFCAQGIEKTLRQFPQVEEVYVSLEHRLVAVELKPDQTLDETALRKSITDAGYATVSVKRTEDGIETIRARVHDRPAHDR